MKPKPTPGQEAAIRGSVAKRPWHPDIEVEDLVATAGGLVENLAQLSDLAGRLPAVKTLLGEDIEVTMATSPSGRGVIVVFEPRQPPPRRGRPPGRKES